MIGNILEVPAPLIRLTLLAEIFTGAHYTNASDFSTEG
jgi:hypothetical protein